MRVQKYNITVYEGALGFSHGMGSEIPEIYIPDLGLYFNEMACFLGNSERSRSEDITDKEMIDIDKRTEDMLMTLKEAMTLQETSLKKLRKKLFE